MRNKKLTNRNKNKTRNKKITNRRNKKIINRRNKKITNRRNNRNLISNKINSKYHKSLKKRIKGGTSPPPVIDASAGSAVGAAGSAIAAAGAAAGAAASRVFEWATSLAYPEYEPEPEPEKISPPTIEWHTEPEPEPEPEPGTKEIELIIEENQKFYDYSEIFIRIDYYDFISIEDDENKQKYLLSSELFDGDTDKISIIDEFIDSVKKLESRKLTNKLRSGMVYNIDEIEFVVYSNVNFEYYELNQKTGIPLLDEKVIITRDKVFNGNSELYTLKLNGTEYLPLVLKVIKGKDKSEEFFAEVFKHIPDYNIDWYHEKDVKNCGIMQSKFLGINEERQYMLLESGIPAESVMDLNKWIRDNINDYEIYVLQSLKILLQIIGQILCLQEYGVYNFDIKSKNILVMQGGNEYDIRVMLIDTGGFIYHIPSLLEKINLLPNKDIILEKINRFFDIKHEYTSYLNIKNLLDNSFPSSLVPYFINGVNTKGFISPKTLEEGKLFNIFAVSLLANELVSRYRNVDGVIRISSIKEQFAGLYWRGWDDKFLWNYDYHNSIDYNRERDKLIEYLNRFNIDEMSFNIFKELIDMFIENWNYFRHKTREESLKSEIVKKILDEHGLEEESQLSSGFENFPPFPTEYVNKINIEDPNNYLNDLYIKTFNDYRDILF